MRVLLVEDDELLGDGLKKGLEQHKFTVDWITDGLSAERTLDCEEFDVMVLDLGLPKLSGLELLERIRKKGITLPVIILTAQESVENKTLVINSGADDYMVKPCNIDELAARIQAKHRRSTGNVSPLLTIGKLTINPSAHTVSYNDEVVTLPRREFVLLQKLAENVGKIVSREQLIQSLYGWSDVDSNTLEVHIHHIRKKLPNNFIRTVRGVGYMITKPKTEEITGRENTDKDITDIDIADKDTTDKNITDSGV
jgi:two-component system response regulator QseB